MSEKTASRGSVREVTMYRIVCGWPGCEESPDSEFYAWSNAGVAWDEAVNSEWREDRNESLIYCLRHPAVWASDHEDGEPFPETPFLLIHDGDTDDPTEDDGKVTRVAPPEGTHDE